MYSDQYHPDHEQGLLPAPPEASIFITPIGLQEFITQVHGVVSVNFLGADSQELATEILIAMQYIELRKYLPPPYKSAIMDWLNIEGYGTLADSLEDMEERCPYADISFPELKSILLDESSNIHVYVFISIFGGLLSREELAELNNIIIREKKREKLATIISSLGDYHSKFLFYMSANN